MQIHVSEKTVKLIRESCKPLYREHHPEFDEIRISDNKIVYEMIKFYLKGTKYAGDLDNE